MLLYFSTDEMQDAKDILNFYRIGFQIEICFHNNKQDTGITNSQPTDFKKWPFTSIHHLQRQTVPRLLVRRWE